MFILNLHFWIAYRLNTRPVYVGIGIYQIIFGLILIFGYDWFVRNPIGIPMLIGGNLFFVLVTILGGRFATISFDEEYDGKDYSRKPKDWKEEWF